MCGIAGILNFDEMSKISETILLEMINTMVHRGPDDLGYYSKKNVGLAHRRLSIIDLKSGNQPICNENGNIWIVFNGEIYNFVELRNELEKKGHKFRTNSDTEVIIHSYEEYGVDCLKKFNGMFAFAIYDETSKRIFLARDRLGVKPLFYNVTNKRFIFASEIKALLKHPEVERKANLLAISSYLSFRYVLGRETMFQDIYALLPGYFLISDGEKFEEKQYWELPVLEHKEDYGEEYYLDRLKCLLKRSIEMRMRSDVPLGAFLSGGLDSSILVALMSEIQNVPVKTYSIGFCEEGFNEFEYVKLITEKFKTSHTEFMLDPKKYIDLLPTLIKFKDAPLSVPNEVALFELSKKLREHITVVLSGEGADELFGGYGRIFRSPFDYERLKLIERNPDLLNEKAKNILINSLNKKYKSLDFKDELAHFLTVYNWMTLEEKKEIFTAKMNSIIGNDEHITDQFEHNFEKIKDLNHYDKYLWIFEKMHLPGLLMRLDTTTMAASVESRVPFVDDHELVEFAFSLPFDYKIRWKSLLHQAMASLLNSDEISENCDTTKYLLKEAFKGKIPRRIIHRKKVGFPVPLHIWFGSEFHEYAEKILLDQRVKDRGIFNTKKLEDWLNDVDNFKSHKFGLKIWMLINVELWFREYFDR